MSAGFVAYLAAIVATSYAGGVIPLLRSWSQRGLLIPVSFSAGILLGAAFFHMIPESAMVLGRALGWPLLGGFLIIFLLERFILVHPYPEAAGEHGRAHHRHFGLAAYIGISFHSLIDGLAVTAAFEQSELRGVVLLAVIFHKMPDTFALASLLLLDRWPRREIALWIALFALTTPAGAVASWLVLRQTGSATVAVAVALSAGTFLAVATSDILPQIQLEDGQRLWPLVALAVGLAFSWLGLLIGS